MALGMKKTNRGFGLAEGVDRYGKPYSIQKSSIATEDCIWLGSDGEPLRDGDKVWSSRMHLTQAMAAELIPLLQHFVDTGELPKPKD